MEIKGDIAGDVQDVSRILNSEDTKKNDGNRKCIKFQTPLKRKDATIFTSTTRRQHM